MINEILKKFGYELVKLDYDYEKYKSQTSAINSSAKTEITGIDIGYVATHGSGVLVKPSTIKRFCVKYSKRAISRYIHGPRLPGENETEFIKRITETDEFILEDINDIDDTSGVIADMGAMEFLIQKKSRESIEKYRNCDY